eukprot:2682752-Amphidinium_carterae.1
MHLLREEVRASRSVTYKNLSSVVRFLEFGEQPWCSSNWRLSHHFELHITERWLQRCLSVMHRIFEPLLLGHALGLLWQPRLPCRCIHVRNSQRSDSVIIQVDDEWSSLATLHLLKYLRRQCQVSCADEGISGTRLDLHYRRQTLAVLFSAAYFFQKHNLT